jgi:iron(III) transport system substrate-binding protein
MCSFQLYLIRRHLPQSVSIKRSFLNLTRQVAFGYRCGIALALEAILKILSALSAGASLAVSVFALSMPASAQVTDSLTIYNAQHEGLTKEWVEAFKEETGIVITVRNGSDLEMANQIVQEGANSPADLFLTENSPAMALVDGKGLFEPVDKETLDLVPEQFRPANGHWTGIAARSTVFAYDKTKLAEDKLPKSMLDLAKPEWKARWAASPSGADFQAIVGAFLQLKGETETAGWLKGMKENVTAVRGNSTAMKAVNAGQFEGALIYHYYYFGDQAKTGENSKNVALHYSRTRIRAPSSRSPAAAFWPLPNTRSRRRHF